MNKTKNKQEKMGKTKRIRLFQTRWERKEKELYKKGGLIAILLLIIFALKDIFL